VACARRTWLYFIPVASHEIYCYTVRLPGKRLWWTLQCFPIIIVSFHGILTKSQENEVDPFLFVLETVRNSGLLERFDVDIHARFNDIEQQVRRVSGTYYETKIKQLQSAPGVNRALPLLLITDELEKSAKLLSKRFPEPLFGYTYLYILPQSVKLMHLIANLTSFHSRG